MLAGFLRYEKTPREGRFSLWHASSWVAAVLLMLSWLATEHFLPWVSWHGEVLSFLAVFFLAWTGLRGYLAGPRAQAIRIPWPALPFALFGLLALIQLATGVMTFWGDVVVVWCYATLCIASLTIGFNLGWSRADARNGSQAWDATALLALAFVVGSVASVVVAFAQVFELWEHSAWIARMPDLRRPGANLGQPNQLATLLVIGVASTAFLHVAGKLTGRTTALVLVLLCAGLAATESRSGVLALVGLLLWWQLKRAVVASQVPRWAGPALAAVFIAMFIGWPHLLNALQLLQGPAENRFGQGDIRLTMWSQLLQSVALRPWWGWGIGEVAEAHNAVAHVKAASNPLSYSHNLLIDWAVWMGLPIASALVCISVVWFWRRAKTTDGPIAWYCLAVLIPLAAHSMVEFPYAYAYFLAPALFLAGLLDGARRQRPLLRMGAKTAAVLLLGLSVVQLWSVVEYLSVEEDFRIVRFEQLKIGRTPADHHRPEVRLLTQLGTLLSGSRIALRPGMPAEDMEQLRKLALRYPWVATQYRYAVALALNGDQPEAIRQFQVIRGQRGEKLYRQIKTEISALAQSHYPQLAGLALP